MVNAGMDTTRRNWLAGMAVAPAALAQSNSAANRPNIIVIISDQFRGDCIGALGLNPMNLTPNLDRMARQGRALPLGLLQSAGMRPGARQYFHRSVSQPPRRLAQRNQVA